MKMTCPPTRLLRAVMETCWHMVEMTWQLGSALRGAGLAAAGVLHAVVHAVAGLALTRARVHPRRLPIPVLRAPVAGVVAGTGVGAAEDSLLLGCTTRRHCQQAAALPLQGLYAWT